LIVNARSCGSAIGRSGLLNKKGQVSEGEGARETAAARLARTRERLLDAVFESLSESGYAGMTTNEVARRSGLTRGAQLHHFGTKGEMMVAATQHMTARARATFATAGLDELPAGADRIRAALTAIAQVYTSIRPSAYTELWMASRSYPEIVDALREAEVEGRDDMRKLFGAEILERATPEFEALIDFIHYAVRGMAVDTYLVTDEQRQDRTDLILGLAPCLEQALAPAVST
jgi:AcrR family transcriptional regulator